MSELPSGEPLPLLPTPQPVPAPLEIQQSSGDVPADKPKEFNDPLAELARRLKQGDKAAWEPLESRLQWVVRSIISKEMDHVPRREQEAFAQDIRGEVCAAIVDSFAFRSKVTTFVASVVSNCCKKRRRRPGKQVPYMPREHDQADTTRKTGMAALADKEAVERLRECMVRLDARDQAILRLKYKEERSLKEISQLLGYPSDNTARQALHRARQRLKRLMGDLE